MMMRIGFDEEAKFIAAEKAAEVRRRSRLLPCLSCACAV